MAKTNPSKPVFFFDIDNCLYSRSKKVHDLMQDLIDQYFITHLSLSRTDATVLHQKYYKEYGLAIEGLVRFHKVDPLEYNKQVDDALPLDNLLTPDPPLRRLLQSLDRTKLRLWLFTNAHITHANRVIKLLDLADIFDGITYCDYTQQPLVCKPHAEMFAKAEAEAGVASPKDCYFVGAVSRLPANLNMLTRLRPDDSHLNCRHAHARGWTTVHLLEAEDPEPAARAARYQIRSLEELRDIFPQFFKTATDGPVVPSQL